jgi:hypothetical protein
VPTIAVRSLPTNGAPIALRLGCCGTESPTRVVAVQDAKLVLVRPVHTCDAPVVDRRVTVLWADDGEQFSADGVVRAVGGQPVRWFVEVVGEPSPANRRQESRSSCHDMAVLRRGSTMIPARVVNRSSRGLGCLVGGASRIAAGEEVTVELRGHRALARVVRVRPSGASLDVGLQLLEPLD